MFGSFLPTIKKSVNLAFISAFAGQEARQNHLILWKEWNRMVNPVDQKSMSLLGGGLCGKGSPKPISFCCNMLPPKTHISPETFLVGRRSSF